MANDTDKIGFFAGEVLEATARQYPDKTAIIAREERLTFSALNEKARALASHLQAEGIEQGERVGLLLPNSAAFALGYYATQKIGAVTVVLDARLRGKELLEVLRDADLSLLITHKNLLSETAEVLKECELPCWVVGGEEKQSFEKRLAAPSTPFTRPRLAPHDDALILYTSGTTGEPKGVVLSYINLAQYPRVMAERRVTDAHTIRGCILPMSHIVGPITCNDAAQKGFTLVIFDQINPLGLLQGIERHKVAVFESVPTVFQLLLGVKNLPEHDTSSLRVTAMMGTTVPPPLLRAFKAAQPHVRVIQGYGLTETSPMITLVELEKAEEKMGSIGSAVPGVEIKIVNDGGEELPQGEPGEIITRGPHVMKGYFRKPEATSARIRGGWLYTGDIGRRDKDGYYYHLGRKDDMIITGGLNVYPAEIENLLYRHPKVQEAVVFPIPDSKRGYVIGAAVVLRPGQAVGERELLGFLRSNLATFKVPHKIKIRDSLPKTSSGKTIRDAAALLSG